MASLVFLLILGLAILLWGLAIVTNFRGYRDSYAQRIGRSSSILTGRRASARYTKAVQLVVGSVFVLGGLAMAASAVVSLIQLTTR